MARHVYGYSKVFDGDSDPDVKDHYYTPVPAVQGGVAQVASQQSYVHQPINSGYAYAPPQGAGRV